MEVALVKYSPLCDTNVEAYLEYLSKFTPGYVSQVACECGVASFDAGVGVERFGGRHVGGRGCFGSVVGGRGRGNDGDGIDGGFGLVSGATESSEAVGLECKDVDGSCGDVGIGDEVGSGAVVVEVQGNGTGSSDGGSKGLDPVKKRKMGKNQRDRAKYGKFGADWRKPVGSGVSHDVKTKARESLEKKWEVENRVAIAKAELAEEKAKKDLEFQRARDVDAEIKRSRTLVMKQTESNKVATEKAFASLKATGNVVGFCETVVSGGDSVPGLSGGSSSAEGCTISPDSSASMHEFRKCQKELEDSKFECAKLRRQILFGKLAAGEEVAFTVHSDGEVSDDVKEAIEKNKNDFFDVELSGDAYEDEKACTLFAKRVSIPGADEYLYDC